MSPKQILKLARDQLALSIGGRESTLAHVKLLHRRVDLIETIIAPAMPRQAVDGLEGLKLEMRTIIAQEETQHETLQAMLQDIDRRLEQME